MTPTFYLIILNMVQAAAYRIKGYEELSITLFYQIHTVNFFYQFKTNSQNLELEWPSLFSNLSKFGQKISRMAWSMYVEVCHYQTHFWSILHCILFWKPRIFTWIVWCTCLQSWKWIKPKACKITFHPFIIFLQFYQIFSPKLSNFPHNVVYDHFTTRFIPSQLH